MTDPINDGGRIEAPIAYRPDHPDPRINDYDHNVMVRPGWFPRTDFPVLEELRQEHERLLARRDDKHAAWAAVQEVFDAEDDAKQAALDRAAREGSEPDLPALTSADERKRQLDDAGAFYLAATRALLSFGYAAVDRLRGEPPAGWHASGAVERGLTPPGGDGEKVLAEIQAEERDLQDQYAEGRRLMEEASERLRAYQPLKVWLVRTANAGDGSPRLLAGADLPVPLTHTPGTKPRDLGVQAWWPDDRGDYEDEPMPSLNPDSDADSGAVDNSDPWFASRERQIAHEEL